MPRPAVLLLERDPTVIDIAQRCLMDEAELHIANSVELALRIASRRPIAVAVLEATMAGAMPSEVVGKLRTQCPGLRVVFLADPGFELDKRYAALGSQLRKPVNEDRLLDAVTSALRLRSMSANVELMRSSSGTYRSLRALAAGLGAQAPATPAPAATAPAAPPAPSSSLRSGSIPPPRGSSAAAVRPRPPIDDDETEDIPRQSVRTATPRAPFRADTPGHIAAGDLRRELASPPSSKGTPASDQARGGPARSR